MGSFQSIARADFVSAFPKHQAAAEQLATAIDALGVGTEQNDAVLQRGELTQALAQDRPRLDPLFCETMGRRVAKGLKNADDIAREVHAALASQVITEDGLLHILKTLCKDPVLRRREAGHPDYIKAAEWVASAMAKAGLEPLGDVVDGARTYLQKFAWEERYAYVEGTPRFSYWGARTAPQKKVSTSFNVCGLLRGTGPEPRDKVLVIAHLDNLSAAQKTREGITDYEGANDNTSSVAAVLAMIEAMSQHGPCDKDIIVLIPSAEEDGLKGTEAWVKAPPVSLDRIACAINSEMLGQNDIAELLVFGGPDGAQARQNPAYRFAVHSAQRYGIHVRPGHRFDDDQKWWGRSDHKITADRGVPSIMLHGRASPGSYHTINDRVEALNLEKIREAARLLFHMVREAANDTTFVAHRGKPTREINEYSGRVWPGGQA